MYHLNRDSAPPWTKVTNIRSRTTREDSIGNAKHIKEDGHWVHPTTTCNRYAAQSDDENIDHLQKVATDSTRKPPPIFVSDVITTPLLLQLLDQIVKQSYEIKALARNKVRIQSKTPDSYRAIIKALDEENTAFHTYKPKHERDYSVVLKNMHFSINPADIQSEVEKLGHTVTNIYNIKQHLTKLLLPMFFVNLKPATNKDIYRVSQD
jgi:hypothetical protein